MKIKLKLQRIMSLVIVALFVFQATEVWATQSKSENFSKSYSLSGGGADKILAVAQAQIGRTKAQMGYTEAWCADFVSDCAKLAGLSDVIPFDGYCQTLYNKVKNAGGKDVSAPQKGDLVFYYCSACSVHWCHVGIMLNSTQSIEGNYGGKVSLVNGSYTDSGGHTLKSGVVTRRYVRPAYVSGNDPSGNIDSVAGGVHTLRVGGWAYDTDDTSKALEIHVYVGGEAGTGAPGYVISANKLRTDVHNTFGVGNYHGFDEEIVVETYGTKDVYIYAINVGGGGNVCLGKRTVTIAQGPGTAYEDLGTNFYAKITNPQLGTVIANQNGYATSRTNTASADRLWKFERQSNKSYKIINCLDGTVLDVDHALTDKCTKVLSCTSNGNSNQRWFINKNGSGYSLMPAHAYGMALDIWKLSATDGAETVICPWTSNDKAEIFKIEKITDISSYYGKVTTLKVYSDSEYKNECTQFEEGATAYFSISGKNAGQFKFVLSNGSSSAEKIITAGDWSLSNLKLGTYTLEVSPINEISSTQGAATITYKVVRKITSDMVTLNTNNYTYDGSEKKPDVTVKDGTKTLSNGTDYIVHYTKNVNAGTATLLVQGKGNYIGSSFKNFTINKANQDVAVAVGGIEIKKGETTSVAIKGHGTTSYSSSDTSVVTVDSAGVVTGHGSGSATITIKISGDNNYNPVETAINVWVPYEAKTVINDKNTEIIIDAEEYVYDGTPKEPNVTVKCGVYRLNAETDYILTYSDNINVGTATVTVEGVGNYVGTVKKQFVIIKSEKKLKSISITSYPEKKDYYIGDTIDLTGLEVQALFDDGSTEIVDDYEVNTEGLTNEAGKKTIMVAYLYNGVWKTTFLNITVWEPDIRLSNSFFDMNIGEIKGVSLGASPSEVSIIWESSNSEVATVDNGWIEALSEGTATITASFVYNGITYKDSMTIQVQPNENEPPMEDEEPNENEQPKEDEESSENEVPKEDEQPDKNEPSKEEETSHQGGVATCHTLAICDICGDEYGELNFANHDGGFEIRNSLTATEENEGYTGDVYCLGCNIKIVEGRAIPKLEKEPEPIVAVSKVKISKLTNSKGKKVKVVIKKAEEVTGYQLTYSTNNKFKKAKTKSVNKNQYTIKNLKKGKRYYIKVRAYKQVDGKIYYGEWSKVKQIKVKK